MHTSLSVCTSIYWHMYAVYAGPHEVLELRAPSTWRNILSGFCRGAMLL